MLRARRLCLFLAIMLLSLQANDGICQMQYSISKDMYLRCAEAIAVYVKKKRDWDKGTYEISFGGIYTLYNAAVFGVTSNAHLEELERKKDTVIMGHHPDDFVVLVDIVDYVVLSENELDTYFPNAQPGYEHPYPGKSKE